MLRFSLCRPLALVSFAFFSAALLWGQCGHPAYTGSSDRDLAAYIHGPFRSWCLSHGGSMTEDGGCDPGPNWHCDSGGNAGGVSGSSQNSLSGAFAEMVVTGSSAAKQQFVGMAVQQLATTFFTALLTPNPAAAARKQQMIEELQRRKKEAAERHELEEAQRLQTIVDNLSGRLKLGANLTELELKSSQQDDGQLHFKLSGDGDSNAHAGAPGLPGIYLNGGNVPYGVQGLPGIYTNGPGSGPVLTESNLQLKLSESGDGKGTGSEPAPEVAKADVKEMTAQQAADLADALSKLTPEQQQQVWTSAQLAANAKAAGSAAPSHAPPALSQLEQIAQTSQSAAAAASPEEASERARAGFDEAVASASTLRPAAAESRPAAAPVFPVDAVVPSVPAVPAATTQPAAAPPSEAKPAQQTNMVLLPEAGVAPGSPIHPVTPRIVPQPPRISQHIQNMTNQQLQAETCHAHSMLIRMKGDFQQDSKSLDEWFRQSEEAQRSGLETSSKCLADLIEVETGARGAQLAEWAFKNMKNLKDDTDIAIAIKQAMMALMKDADETYEKSGKTRADKLDYARAVLQAFYSMAKSLKMDQLLECGNSVRTISTCGADITGAVQCAYDYVVAGVEWEIAREQIEQTSGNMDDKLKAQKVLSGFYRQLVDESLDRGLNPASCN